MRMATIRRGLRAALFVVITAAVLSGVYRILSWKDTMGEYLSSTQALYATGDGLVDVLFIGSSHVYAAVSPDHLWRDHGISAFNMAISGQDKISALHYLREALKTQSPRVVFVDLYAAAYDLREEEESEEVLLENGNVYRNMLSMRTSPNQVSMVMETELACRPELILKWPVVHGRYRELRAFDFVQNPRSICTRGYLSLDGAEEVIHEPSIENLPDSIPVSAHNREWLDALMSLSDREGFDLVPMILPHEPSVEEKEIYNGVVQYLAEREEAVLDFNHLIADMDLSYLTDFRDPGHLNENGAEKLTGWLGEFLEENYDLADHRGDEAYALWDESLACEEHTGLMRRVEEAGDADTCFELLSGLKEEQTVVLYLGDVPEGSAEEYRSALAALGVGEAFLSGACYAVVDEGRVTYLPEAAAGSFFIDLDEASTLWLDVEEGEYGAFVNGEKLLPQSDGLWVRVYDRRLGKLYGPYQF